MTGSEALRQVLEETRAVVRLGSAGRVSPSSRDRRASASDAERRAGGAPNVPDRGGILEGGACPLLQQTFRPGGYSSSATFATRGEEPMSRRIRRWLVPFAAAILALGAAPAAVTATSTLNVPGDFATIQAAIAAAA